MALHTEHSRLEKVTLTDVDSDPGDVDSDPGDVVQFTTRNRGGGDIHIVNATADEARDLAAAIVELADQLDS